ncbi:MAG: MOSC domain-containing protein [Bacteroidia bacterium]
MLTAIYCYPIKSLGGISLTQAEIEDRGIRYDRRWILTDLEGNMLTQRTLPKMALCKTAFTDHGIQVSAEGYAPLHIIFGKWQEESATIQVWDTAGKAHAVDQEADRWFSEVLGKTCRLWYMPDASERKLESSYTSYEGPMSFADGWPLLVVSEASLASLNERLDSPVNMDRFRPNLVVSNVPAFEEDNWQKIQIGNVLIEGGKPCGRCTVITIDQQTGEKGKEPLRNLATWRKTDSGSVIFGWNMFSKKGGSLAVGDSILKL